MTQLFNSDAAAVASAFRALSVARPLRETTGRYVESNASAHVSRGRSEILRRCPRGGRSLEIVGNGSGYDSVYLSLRGVTSSAIVPDGDSAGRASYAASMLGSDARYFVGDPFNPATYGAGRWNVIHHDNFIEHLNARQMRAVLATQVVRANWVVFSVTSMHYKGVPPVGDELLWPLPELQYHLRDFKVDTLEYSDDGPDGRERILCVLRGQKSTPALRAAAAGADAVYKPGVTVLVVARNEEVKLKRSLDSVAFATAIIVADMSSTDRTREIAQEAGALVVTLDHVSEFDFIRTIIAQRVETEWCLILDADEVVLPGLAGDIIDIVGSDSASFAGMYLPFRHYLGSHWLKMLAPGYTAPRLLRTGRFYVNKALHGGIRVDGSLTRYPATDPDRTILHFTSDSCEHHLAKQNRYTTSEAEAKFKQGEEFSAARMLRAWLGDLIAYQDTSSPSDDGPWRLIYSMFGAAYRFNTYAKLLELRANAGLLRPHELEAPNTVAEIMTFLLNELRGAAAYSTRRPVDVEVAEGGAAAVFTAPFEHVSGYGEDSRATFMSLVSAGIAFRARNLPWAPDASVFTDTEREPYERAITTPAAPAYVHLIQSLAEWPRLPGARATIARYMFETDRLPRGVPQQLNELDLVVVPSEFNAGTFACSGVDSNKLRIVPCCIDAQRYASAEAESVPLAAKIRGAGRFTFLSIGEMSLRKGFDILLPAWLRAFDGRSDVQLVIRTWSASVPLNRDEILSRLSEMAVSAGGQPIGEDDRIVLLLDEIPRNEMPSLHAAADAFVLSTRGEGWGRPMMESMCAGKIAISTGGTGNTAFMSEDNSLLVDYDWRPASAELYQEIPPYRGHCCVEPRVDDLIDKMRFAVGNAAEASERALRGQARMLSEFSCQAVGARWKEVLQPFI